MPCSSQTISEMLPEIRTAEKYYFLKHIIFLKSFNSVLFSFLPSLPIRIRYGLFLEGFAAEKSHQKVTEVTHLCDENSMKGSVSLLFALSQNRNITRNLTQN